MRNSTLARTVGFVAALFSLVPLAAAASDAPPAIADMWIVTPKPGHSAEFTEAIRAHMAFRSESGDPRSWQAYTPVLGNQLTRVALRYCCMNWADADGYRDWQQNNPAIEAHFAETVAPHMAGAAHYFETMDWANSHWNKDQGPFRLFAVTEFHLKAGHTDSFDAARDKMSQIALEQGWAADGNIWLWATTMGGAPREAIIIPHRDFSSLGQQREHFAQFLANKLGSPQAAADLLQQFQDSIEGSDFQIWEHQPSLSMPEGD